jgi:putative SOS response-associated peptidase YedK
LLLCYIPVILQADLLQSIHINISGYHACQSLGTKLSPIMEWPTDGVKAGGWFPCISNEFKQIIQCFRWGMVPGWSRGLQPLSIPTVKKESLTANDSINAIAKYYRCVIPVTSIVVGNKTKGLSHIEFNNITLLAGLWNVHGDGLNSFCIITQAAKGNQLLKDESWPCTVPLGNYTYWLNTSEGVTQALRYFDK